MKRVFHLIEIMKLQLLIVKYDDVAFNRCRKEGMLNTSLTELAQ